MDTGKTIRVVAADRSPHDLNALCVFLKRQQPIEIVGMAGNGPELLKLAEALRPELVIANLRLPRVSGIECARRLRESTPETRSIIFTDMDAPFTEAECAVPGADFYLYKEHMPGRLLGALHRLFPELDRRRASAQRTDRGQACKSVC